MSSKLFGYLSLIIAMVLGWVVGYFQIPYLLKAADVIADIMLKLLKLVSLPIIFLSIVSTLSGMKSIQEMKPIGKKVLGYTLLTTIAAGLIAFVVFLVIAPNRASQGIGPVDSFSLDQATYLSFFLDMIPSNPIQPFVENNVMGVVFLAGVLGISILFLSAERKNHLHLFFSSLFDAVINITKYIVKLIPIGVFAFSVKLMIDLSKGGSYGKALFLYLACVVGANLIQGIIFLPAFMKWKKISPIKTFKGMLPALLMAFFTKSSNATLPISMHAIQKNLGVSPQVAQFSMPLCTVINMNACAGFIFTTVLFVSTASGVVFSIPEMLLWVILATLAAIGNAGVPMGCFFLTSAFLSGMKVPLDLMGIILPFYAILDMIETAINVWSDAAVTLVVDKEIKEELALKSPAISTQQSEVTPSS